MYIVIPKSLTVLGSLQIYTIMKRKCLSLNAFKRRPKSCKLVCTGTWIDPYLQCKYLSALNLGMHTTVCRIRVKVFAICKLSIGSICFLYLNNTQLVLWPTEGNLWPTGGNTKCTKFNMFLLICQYYVIPCLKRHRCSCGIDTKSCKKVTCDHNICHMYIST